MCGIAGIYSYDGAAPPVDEAELLRMREHMAKRGPDGAGLWVSPDRRVGLAHRRLAIIDLSESGAQPMVTADGRMTITFNGEIYNYRALRRELEAKGYVFRTQSDTEALLHLYADRGAAMVHELRGMFALAIWDAVDRTLFLARDPFGIKPLYCADTRGCLRFASQVKALLKGGGIDTAPEPAGAAGFLLWGSVPEPFTLYRDIVALPAGSTLTVRDGEAGVVHTYFRVRDTLVRAQECARPFVPEDHEALAAALGDSVRHHLVSDEPVGVFLSAGVDSALVTSIASRQQPQTLRTLTLGFEEYRGRHDDEVPGAERNAAALGTRHETHWVAPDDFRGEMARILEAMDQPSTDGVNTYFICREAARAGIKVAMSALGGDELFGGYPSFRDVPRMASWLRLAAFARPAARLARVVMHPLLSRVASPKLAGLLEFGGTFEGAYFLRRALYMPWELGDILDPVAVHVGLERLQTLPHIAESIRGLRSDFSRVAAVELSWYMRNQLLRDADWAGMAHSVEVRVPLVDVELFRALAPWMVSGSAPTKSDAMAAVAIAFREEVLRRPKTGFAVPVREWISREEPKGRPSERGLRGWARTVLPRQPRQFRALALVTDAFGGHGGIAKYNRDLLESVAAMRECAELVVVPRRVPEEPQGVPAGIRLTTDSAGGKWRFARTALREMSGPYDLMLVGHINLAPLAMAIAAAKRARSLLVIHGIDAWTPHRNPLVRRSLRRLGFVVGVSRVTLDRFASWARVSPGRLRLLHNCVNLRQFSPGPRPEHLERQLGLSNRTVIMTLGRLASEERKGFDEVIEALSDLSRHVPAITYLICGDGPDRKRLEAKAVALGVGDRVVFSGFVPEAHKSDYYRLADAYVMPSRGEGFGIVFLEAMASGLPVMGSKVDGSREALLGGALGELVDPSNPGEVLQGILRTLGRGKAVPEELKQFSVEAFRVNAGTLAREALACR